QGGEGENANAPGGENANAPGGGGNENAPNQGVTPAPENAAPTPNAPSPNAGATGPGAAGGNSVREQWDLHEAWKAHPQLGNGAGDYATYGESMSDARVDALGDA